MARFAYSVDPPLRNAVIKKCTLRTAAGGAKKCTLSPSSVAKKRRFRLSGFDCAEGSFSLVERASFPCTIDLIKLEGVPKGKKFSWVDDDLDTEPTPSPLLPTVPDPEDVGAMHIDPTERDIH